MSTENMRVEPEGLAHQRCPTTKVRVVLRASLSPQYRLSQVDHFMGDDDAQRIEMRNASLRHTDEVLVSAYESSVVPLTVLMARYLETYGGFFWQIPSTERATTPERLVHSPKDISR